MVIPLSWPDLPDLFLFIIRILPTRMVSFFPAGIIVSLALVRLSKVSSCALLTWLINIMAIKRVNFFMLYFFIFSDYFTANSNPAILRLLPVFMLVVRATVLLSFLKNIPALDLVTTSLFKRKI